MTEHVEHVVQLVLLAQGSVILGDHPREHGSGSTTPITTAGITGLLAGLVTVTVNSVPCGEPATTGFSPVRVLTSVSGSKTFA